MPSTQATASAKAFPRSSNRSHARSDIVWILRRNLGYSLLRQRTKGEVTSATEWPGYRAGQNRKGAGLNVAEELRQPRRLASGDKYDVLVVTERHDLPAIARKERTAFYLTDMARHLLAGNPDAEVLLYHTWLNVDPDEPWPWIDYERAVSPMWECVASRANLDLPARGNVPRVRVLPGGGALAELAAALWDGKVPGVAGSTPGERVRLLFSDNVHMSDVGRYYIALVHYAVLFGRNPEGAAIPTSLAPELGRYMQTLAWQYTVSYGQRANAAARRDMAACRDLMQNEVCPAYVAFQSKGPRFLPHSSASSTPIVVGASMPTQMIPKTHSLRPSDKGRCGAHALSGSASADSTTLNASSLRVRNPPW